MSPLTTFYESILSPEKTEFNQPPISIFVGILVYGFKIKSAKPDEVIWDGDLLKMIPKEMLPTDVLQRQDALQVAIWDALRDLQILGFPEGDLFFLNGETKWKKKKEEKNEDAVTYSIKNLNIDNN